MRVDDLLHVDSLDLELVWGEQSLLRTEISGVTATDLLNPSRFVQEGEVVLSGLVWWTSRSRQDKADQFVAALCDAGAAALLAGDEHHNGIPTEVVRACQEQRLPLLSVPASTSFRTVMDTIYLRRWGRVSNSPSPHAALPPHVRKTLTRLIRENVTPATVLDHLSAYLGQRPCMLVTATGRTLARSSNAPALPAETIADNLRQPEIVNQVVGVAESPFDAWYLQLSGAYDAPTSVVREMAEILRHYRESAIRKEHETQPAVDELLAHIQHMTADGPALVAALRACGLAEQGPYQIVTAVTEGYRAAAALRELLAHITEHQVAVADCGDAAIGLIEASADTADRLRAACHLLQACDPHTAVHIGVGSIAHTADELHTSYLQARHTRRAAITLGRSIATTDELTSVTELLAGVAAPIRSLYSRQVLGSLLDPDHTHAGLLETLETFLDHNGSWIRTAEAMHLHVNTVHYRIEHVERLINRDLSRLDHRLDLRAALLSRR